MDVLKLAVHATVRTITVPMAYERDNIRALEPYTSGEQPDDARVIKLNTNENPYPPSPAVLDVIVAVTGEQLRRYPSPAAASFRETAARVHSLSADNVIATNGGDELLRLAITCFCEPSRQGGGIGITEPTYSLYKVLAAIHDTPVTRVSLADDFSLPDDLAAQWNTAGCRLGLVVNPHAPSGALRSVKQLERIARAFDGVLLVDEAYVDFAAHDALPLLDAVVDLDNVILLRTLSKGYSLAGLRMGYGLAHAALIATMDKARDSYNTDVVAQAAATTALCHRDEAKNTWSVVIDERDRLTRAFSDLFFDVWPSQSNFLLVRPPSGSAAGLYQSLKTCGILVRYFDQPGLEDKLRVTVGTADQNDALLAAIQRIPGDSSRA